MGKINNPVTKGCAILAVLVVGVPLLVVSVVGVKTWVPLLGAGDALEELDRSLGSAASYLPTRSGEIPAERMELFLDLRSALVTACGDYGQVQEGMEAIETLESRDPRDPVDVGEVALEFGGTALSITPFLARYFELRNEALLAATMGLEEYSYIYAAAYHDLLLSRRTRNEIFSGGEALSPEASAMLRGCLARQLDALRKAGDDGHSLAALATELDLMEQDPSRLAWQDGLPDAVVASITPHREQLDSLFCGATAGLEMEGDANRALALALE